MGQKQTWLTGRSEVSSITRRARRRSHAVSLIERVAVWNTRVTLACRTRVSSIADTARGARDAVPLEGRVAVCNARVRRTG